MVFLFLVGKYWLHNNLTIALSNSVNDTTALRILQPRQ